MANLLWDEEQQLFRNCLKGIRTQAKLTQKELADLLDKPQSYVSKYESGERKLGYLEIREICLACNISIAQFDELLKTPSNGETLG